jgi:hypothetical protein
MLLAKFGDQLVLPFEMRLVALVGLSLLPLELFLYPTLRLT